MTLPYRLLSGTLVLLLTVLAGCSQADAPAPETMAEPTELPTEVPIAEPTEVPAEAPAVEPTEAPAEAPAEVPSEEPTVAAPLAEATVPPPQEAESVEEREAADIMELNVGAPGRYVNVAFGYLVDYPENWYTGFGSRPLRASFSNLDPGSTNRDNMRASGCLIEVVAEANIYGFTLQTLMTQLPQSFENAEMFMLGGVEAVRIRNSNPNVPYDNEQVQVVAGGRLFSISAAMARGQEAVCLPAWESFLSGWSWFTPDFTTYRNVTYGYSLSYPTPWQVVAETEQGITLSSQDPAGKSSIEEMAGDGFAMQMQIYPNDALLPLKAWIAANVAEPGLTNDIQLDTLLGVRSIVDLPDGLQKMTGYFQGPLGKIYVVECFYPAQRASEFRPIANAMLYSFSF